MMMGRTRSPCPHPYTLCFTPNPSCPLFRLMLSPRQLSEMRGDLEVARGRAEKAERQCIVLSEALARLHSELRCALADREAAVEGLLELRRAKGAAAAATAALARRGGGGRAGSNAAELGGPRQPGSRDEGGSHHIEGGETPCMPPSRERHTEAAPRAEHPLHSAPQPTAQGPPPARAPQPARAIEGRGAGGEQGGSIAGAGDHEAGNETGRGGEDTGCKDKGAVVGDAEGASTPELPHAPPPRVALGGLSAAHDDARHLRTLVSELRRMLETERRDAHAAKTRLAAELARTTDAEKLLRVLISDAQRGVVAARAAAAAATSVSRDPRAVASEAYKQETCTTLPLREGQTLLASLLAHEHVLAAVRKVVFHAP